MLNSNKTDTLTGQVWKLKLFFNFIYRHQSVLPSGGAGLPEITVLQHLQERSLLPVVEQYRARTQQPESHRWRPDTGANPARNCGGGWRGSAAATNGSLPAGGHVFIRRRRELEVHLRTAWMGGGDTGQSFTDISENGVFRHTVNSEPSGSPP